MSYLEKWFHFLLKYDHKWLLKKKTLKSQFFNLQNQVHLMCLWSRFLTPSQTPFSVKFCGDLAWKSSAKSGSWWGQAHPTAFKPSSKENSLWGFQIFLTFIRYQFCCSAVIKLKEKMSRMIKYCYKVFIVVAVVPETSQPWIMRFKNTSLVSLNGPWFKYSPLWSECPRSFESFRMAWPCICRLPWWNGDRCFHLSCD